MKGMKMNRCLWKKWWCRFVFLPLLLPYSHNKSRVGWFQGSSFRDSGTSGHQPADSLHLWCPAQRVSSPMTTRCQQPFHPPPKTWQHPAQGRRMVPTPPCLFSKSKSSFPRSPPPRTNLLRPLISQNRVTCPPLNQSLSRGMEFLWLTQSRTS